MGNRYCVEARRANVGLLAHVILLGIASAPAFGQLIVDRFTVESETSIPNAISRNGDYVVGTGWTAPWVWSRSSGVTILPTNADDRAGLVEHAVAVSDDGRRIIGMGQVSGRCDDDREVFVYENGTWSSLLGDDSSFGGLSAHGSIIGANAYVTRDEDDCPSATGTFESAIRVTAGGIQLLPPPEGLHHSLVAGMSDSGMVVAGNAVHTRTAEGNWLKQAVVWDESGDITAVPLPPGAVEVLARGISGDGKTVVGHVKYTDQYGSIYAFRWNRESGLMLLSPTGQEAAAFDVSYDGGIVVGAAAPIGPIVWIDDPEPVTLAEYLSDFGFHDDQFQFVDMSDDGRTFLGTSRDEIVVVTIPEPFGCLPCAMAVVGFVCFARRRFRGQVQRQ
jgi:hypothetical protein